MSRPDARAAPSVEGGEARVVGADVDRMAQRLFLGEPRARSAFWVLLLLAAVIASSGVVADATATVIGAMIVAPLMTPILGTALAVVLAERRQMLICAAFVLTGGLAVVVVGYLLGLAVDAPVVAETNDQVAGRVSPKLIDLISALATGGVGAFALVRSDVSDALPGVAIAISLVPPLSVVGLTLESGEPGQSLGALLLFGTNVTAIIGARQAGAPSRVPATSVGWHGRPDRGRRGVRAGSVDPVIRLAAGRRTANAGRPAGVAAARDHPARTAGASPGDRPAARVVGPLAPGTATRPLVRAAADHGGAESHRLKLRMPAGGSLRG